jgi:putative DNA primase/helicase
MHQSFEQFAAAVGLVASFYKADGKIHRCPTADHPRSKNGAYLFDGRRGFAMDWASGEPLQWWNDRNSKPWSDAEKREWADRKRIAEKARLQGYLEAAEKASQILSECAIDAHAYLKSKQLPDARGMVSTEGVLLIPMRDCGSNKLVGLQAIKWNEETEKFEKKFLPGMKAKEAVYRLGTGSEAILCEGYATGLSVHAAVKRLRLNVSVICCFSASNIIHVAKTHGHFVMADNDSSRTGEQAAAATGLPWLMPDTVGEDWNDVHSSEGLIAVCKAVMQLRKVRAVG